MLIFHDEHTFRCDRKVFAILLMSSSTRLINLEVGTQKIDFDNAQVTFFNNAAVREYALRQKKDGQAEKQANTDDTVHNHDPILPTLSFHPKE